MEEWEGLFRGLDLWIDIKGSGVPYTEEARLDFQKALPRGCLSQVIDSTTELRLSRNPSEQGTFSPISRLRG